MARKAVDPGGDEDELPQSDRAGESVHPRANFAFFGHDAAEQRFSDGVFGTRPAHSWLIEGPRGIGKATLAYRAARALLGARRIGPRPFDCARDDPVCRRLASLGERDFRIIRREYDFDRKKLRNEIRAEDSRGLPGFLALTGSGLAARVAIVDATDDLNPQSANAILKIVEEPPPAAFIFLISHNERPILPTIRSRCRTLRLRPIAEEKVADALGIAGYQGEIGAAARLCAGRPGRAFQGAAELRAQISMVADRLISARSGQQDNAEFARLGGEDAETFEASCDLLLEKIVAVAKAASTGRAEWAEAYTGILHHKTEAIDLNMDLPFAARIIAGIAQDCARASLFSEPISGT